MNKNNRTAFEAFHQAWTALDSMIYNYKQLIKRASEKSLPDVIELIKVKEDLETFAVNYFINIQPEASSDAKIFLTHLEWGWSNCPIVNAINGNFNLLQEDLISFINGSQSADREYMGTCLRQINSELSALSLKILALQGKHHD